MHGWIHRWINEETTLQIPSATVHAQNWQPVNVCQLKSHPTQPQWQPWRHAIWMNLFPRMKLADSVSTQDHCNTQARLMLSPYCSWPRIPQGWLPERDYFCPVWAPEKQSLFWAPHQLARAFSELHWSLRVFTLHPSAFHLEMSDLHYRLTALPAYSKSLTQQLFCRIEFCKWLCWLIRLQTPIILISSANYLSKALYQCILPLIVW